MSEGLLWLVTVIYLFVSASLAWEGKIGPSVCFAGYAVANLGLILTIR